MSQDIHTLYAMQINGTLIDQIREQSVDSGLREIILGGDGAVDPTYAALMDIDPKMTFQTTAIAEFLAVCGINGLAISSNVVLYYQKTTEDGIRTAGSNHKSVTVAAGMVIPRTISARQGGEALLTFDIIIRSTDGLTAPFTMASSVALPAGATVAALWTLGPWKLNGTMQEGSQSLDLDFGLRERVMKHSGHVYPYRIHIEERRPKLRLRTTDVAFWHGNAAGVAQGATASIAWFRKMAREGARVAAGTSEHISATVYDGIWKPTRASGSHPSEQMVDVEIEPISDGTNAIIGLSAAAAIA